jgi:hypothetical protein
MKNWQKYLAILGIGFLTGCASAFTDKTHSFGDYARHGIIAMLPALTGLKTKLEKEEGINENGKTN